MKTAPNLPRKAQRGFTLIEIAIVLVIIGLLLGGVLQGQQLIENSRVKGATNDFNGIAAATFSYQDRYGRLPGDDNAGSGAIATRGDTWSTSVEGDADGVIDAAIADTFTGLAAGESGDFFQHLRAAGFIGGDTASVGAEALPQNPFGGLIGITTGAVNGDLNGTKICMSNVGGSSAIALDTQLDDGNGATGRFRATLGTGGANTAPTNVALAAPYSEDDIYTVCYRI
jgi:prepilin-type N-terminal cleavage/methylation domain-containing protein